MCLGVPGKVLALPDPETGMARVGFAGVEKEICLLYLPEVSVGAHVLVHAGFALAEIDEEQAQATLAALASLGEPVAPEEGA